MEKEHRDWCINNCKHWRDCRYIENIGVTCDAREIALYGKVQTKIVKIEKDR